MNALIPIQSRDLLLQDKVEHINKEEVFQLISIAEDKYNSLTRKGHRNEYIKERNQLTMMLMWVTGARVTDVLNFRLSLVDSRQFTLKYYVEKVNKFHTIKLDPDVILKIKDYASDWQITDLLFTKYQDRNNLKASPMKYENVEIFLNDYTEFGKMRHIHPHMFRHGIAMYLAQNGVNFDIIAYYLKHSSVAVTTSFYARIDHEVADIFIKKSLPSLL